MENTLSLTLPDTFVERAYLSAHFDTIVDYFNNRTEQWAEKEGIFNTKKKEPEDLTADDKKALTALNQLKGTGFNKKQARGLLEAICAFNDASFDTNKVLEKVFPVQNQKGRYRYIHGLLLKTTKPYGPKYAHGWGSKKVVIPKGSIIFYLGGHAEQNAVALNPNLTDPSDKNKNILMGYFNINDNAKVEIPTKNEIIDYFSNLCESQNKTPIKKVYACLAKLQKEAQKS